MIVGEVTSLQPSPSPVTLSPANSQTQLTSITVRLPEEGPPTSSILSQKSGGSRQRQSSAPARTNEVVIFTHAIIGSGSFGIVYRASCHRFKSMALKVCFGKPNRLQKEWAALSKCALGEASTGASSDANAGSAKTGGKARSVSAAAAARSKSRTASAAAVGTGAILSSSGSLPIPEVFFAAWSKEDPNLLVIGMELCVPLTLHDLLVSDTFPLSVGAYLAREVAEAVAYVHKCECIHRDVKLQNFVFSLNGRLKLIDFGIATDTLTPPPGDVTAGTLAFMAPEMASNVLSGKEDRVSVGAPSDVWSLGVLLFCIFTQSDLYTDVCDDPRTPGADDFNTRLLHRVSRGEWRWPEGSEQAVPRGFRELIELCLQLDPTRRPTMAEVMGMACWGERSGEGGSSTNNVGVPQEVKSFLAVDTLGVDERGAVRVEGASVRRSPSGQMLLGKGIGGGGLSAAATPVGVAHLPSLRNAAGGESASSLVNDLLSPLREYGVPAVANSAHTDSLLNDPPVSRALLTGDTTPHTLRVPPPVLAPPPPLPEVTMPPPPPPSAHTSSSLQPLVVLSPSVYNTDDALLGLISPPSNLAATGGEGGAGRRTYGGGGLSVTPEAAMRHLMYPPAIEPSTSAGKHTTTKILETVPPALLKKKLPRALHQSLVREEKEARDEIIKERDQALADLTSLFNCQSENFKHPHRFKFYDKPMNNNYREGYMCDLCGTFFAPKKGFMLFFHCSCGSDLCEPCHSEYKQRCTCDGCGTTLENPQSLNRHKLKCDAKEREREERGAARGSRRGSLAMPTTAGRKRERSQTLAGEGATLVSANTTIRQLPRTSKSASRTNGGGRGGRGTSSAAAGDAGGYCLPTVPASNAPLVTEPIVLNPLSPLAHTERWAPFESCKLKAAADVEAALAMMPTENERQAIVGDGADWVRYFHYYPEGLDAEALVYSVQPGRTGSIFLSNTSSIHSAVVAVVESKVLVVDFVDAQTGYDRVRTLTLEEGKRQQPTSIDILLNVVQRDTNLLKQRRAVGTMSQYQRQQTGIGCFGEPFIYVRWVRRDLANKIDVFCLSNGGYQVFIRDSYELRWLHGGRKFRVRSNGVCELVDEATFASIPALVEITGAL